MLNIFFLWLHREAFQLEPILMLCTMAIHFMGLLFFPYKKFFKM